ncbi:hypothetical protein D3C76_1732000 [compost metagenome]
MIVASWGIGGLGRGGVTFAASDGAIWLQQIVFAIAVILPVLLLDQLMKTAPR